MTIRDETGAVTERAYYRYYTSDTSTGFKHGLKYRFDGEGCERLYEYAAEHSTTIDALTETDSVTLATGNTASALRAYATEYREYGVDRRVTLRATRTTGCSGSCGGVGVSTYEYTTQPIALQAVSRQDTPYGTAVGDLSAANPLASHQYSFEIVEGEESFPDRRRVAGIPGYVSHARFLLAPITSPSA